MTRSIAAVVAVTLFLLSGSASAQDSVSALGDQRLADAKMFIAEGEWDAALAVLEEVGWYYPDGDPKLQEAAASRRDALFGKAKDRADGAMARADYAGAVAKYEEALSYKDDADTRRKLDQARAAMPPPVEPVQEDPTPAEASHDDPTPAEPVSDEPTPADPASEDPLVEETTPEQVVIDTADPPTASIEDAPAEPVTAAVGVSIGDEGDALASVDDGGHSERGQAPTRGRGLTWLLLAVFAVLFFAGVGVVGTRSPVLLAIAGGLQTAGWNRGALSLYQILQRRKTDDPSLQVAYAECLIAQGEVGDEARQIYVGVTQDSAPAEFVLQLADLYWSHGLLDEQAATVYRAAAEIDPANPDRWEAREACLGPDDVLDRLEIASKLIDMGCPSPQRLLLVADQYSGGEPTEQQRDIFAQVLRGPDLEGDDKARRVSLIGRLLSSYQELDLVGEDAVIVREAFLLSIDREKRPHTDSFRMSGPRASQVRVVLGELARLLAESGQPQRLFDVYLSLLQRFRAEPVLLDGLLQTAADIGAYERALEAVNEFFPLDQLDADPALAIQVALALMVAGSRNLRERARDTSITSAEFPGLTFFNLARKYFGVLDLEETFRPDVREQIQLFLDLYRRNEQHLSVLDGELASILWKVGDYPGACAIFMWACGFEPHVKDAGLMLANSEEGPPCSEYFPDDRSTLTHLVVDKSVDHSDVDQLVESVGVMDARVAFIVTSQPVDPGIRRYAASDTKVPVAIAEWKDLSRALFAGHARQTLRRIVRGLLRYSVPPRSGDTTVEDVRVFGRDALVEELSSRLARRVPGRPLIISGIRGVGKSTLVQRCLRGDEAASHGLFVPEGDPDVYIPDIWHLTLEKLFESARSRGLVAAHARFPQDAVAPGPADGAAVYLQQLRSVLAQTSHSERGVAIVVDPLDGLFPVCDPIDPDRLGADGAEAMLQALVDVGDQGASNVVLITRQVGASSTRDIGGRPDLLPEDCDEVVVGLLESADCNAMFAAMASDLAMDLDDPAKATFTDASGGHPLVMWLIADSMSAFRARGTNVVGVDEAATILGTVMRNPAFETFARNLVADFTSAEQTLLRALAQAADGTIRPEEMARSLPAFGARYDSEGLLDGLARTTLVSHVTADSYRLRIGLLRRMLATEYPSL